MDTVTARELASKWDQRVRTLTRWRDWVVKRALNLSRVIDAARGRRDGANWVLASAGATIRYRWAGPGETAWTRAQYRVAGATGFCNRGARKAHLRALRTSRG